jgi:translation initiation factor 2 subunit 3
MATMLSGATIMDGAYLLIAANEACPQPQTREHLMALKIVGIDKVVVLQNKIDMVDDKQAKKNHDQIKDFLKGTKYEKALIIPISARYGINLGAVIEATEKGIPTPKRDPKKDPLLLAARSFDVNKPGTDATRIVGGVLGGALKQGVLKEGEEIEIRPGYGIERKNQRIYEPLMTKITGLMTGSTKVKDIKPGGSVGVMTNLDPSIVKSDSLTGSVVGLPGRLPPTRDRFTLEVHLLKRVVGAKDNLLVEPVKQNEPLMLNVNSAATVGVVSELKKDNITFALKLPVCAEADAHVTLSRRIDNRWRLIGYGLIKD